MKILKKGEKGFTIIEVLIATLILMIFAPALFIGLQTSAHATIKADGQATAEAAAKSEVEFIKAQVYEPDTDWVYSLPSGVRPWTGGPVLPAGYTLTVSAGAVPAGLSVSISNSGSGYSSAPEVGFVGGGGAGATGTATITTGVNTITVTSGGSGYISAPTVSLSGGGGTGATATAHLAGQSVDSIIINNRGSGYTSEPAITLSGGGGTGATAVCPAVIGLTGYLVTINVTDQGTGYTSAPSVVISGGGGSGAQAIAQIAAISDIQQIIVTVSRGTSTEPWGYVNYTLSDYWRTP